MPNHTIEEVDCTGGTDDGSGTQGEILVLVVLSEEPASRLSDRVECYWYKRPYAECQERV